MASQDDELEAALANLRTLLVGSTIDVNEDKLIQRVKVFYNWKSYVEMYERPDGGYGGMSFQEFIAALGVSIPQDELEIVLDILDSRDEHL